LPRLSAAGIAFHALKDQAIFDGDEVLTQAGKPFSVFTPYKNAWLKRLTAADYAAYATMCAANWPAASWLASPAGRNRL
jgi:deoxyribodipyrimidine photolyase